MLYSCFRFYCPPVTDFTAFSDSGDNTHIHFRGKYHDVYSTPTKGQRAVFDLLGIKYEYKGEDMNAETQAPQEM